MIQYDNRINQNYLVLPCLGELRNTSAPVARGARRAAMALVYDPAEIGVGFNAEDKALHGDRGLLSAPSVSSDPRAFSSSSSSTEPVAELPSIPTPALLFRGTVILLVNKNP